MDDKSLAALDGLASKLGITTNHLYQIMVNQAPVNAIGQLILLVCSTIAVLVFLYIGTTTIWRAETQEGKATKKQVWLIVMSLIIALIATIVFLGTVWHVPDILTGFKNPEYWALKELKETTK
jgi:hypothetical protein